MAMYMEQSDRMMELNPLVNLKVFAFFDPLLQVDIILAVHVVDMEDIVDSGHVGVFESFT